MLSSQKKINNSKGQPRPFLPLQQRSPALSGYGKDSPRHVHTKRTHKHTQMHECIHTHTVAKHIPRKPCPGNAPDQTRRGCGGFRSGEADISHNSTLLKSLSRPGEVAKWLRALPALSEDLVGALVPTSEGSNNLSDLHEHPRIGGLHSDRCTHVTNKINIPLKFI